MASIFHGGNTYIFYNTDTGNVQPTNIGYKNIDQLGAFPQVKINSSNTTLETYNDEWVQVLSGNLTIDSVSIVIHYIADNDSHIYLTNAFSTGTAFQIKIALYESSTSLNQHYIILNGHVSGYQDSADQNEVYDRTFTFVPTSIVARGTATDPAVLHVGDYGVGADGETTPHVESNIPSGNSFIKVPALRADNTVGVDMGGIAFIDNGGDKYANIVATSEGQLNLYARNSDNAWTEIPLKSDNDTYYVPMARTVNGKALSSNIVLSNADIGSVPVERTVNGKALSSNIVLTSADTGSVPVGRTINSKPLSDDIVLTSADTGSVPVERTVNGKPLSDDIVLSRSDVGLDAVLNATQLVASNNLSDVTDVVTARTNLDVYSKDESVPADRTVNGKPLSDDIVLTSTDTGSFSIANNLSEGVPATIRTNISAAKSGDNSDITSLTSLSGTLRLGADAVGAYDAVTLRQLQASTGTGSATINGVMNNFLGAVEWFLGTRGAMPGGHLAADGQLLSRAAYPDLWNAISTGVLQSITDASWQSTPTGRGSYSTGDGSTTFRMPDLNGVWTHPTDSTLNSIPALFLRGDGAVANTGNGVGVIRWGAVPNITGVFNILANGASPGTHFNTDALSGAFYRTSNTTGSTQDGWTANFNNNYSGGTGIDASRSNISYGRDASTEVRPNSVKGIWLIRVNGLFSAANTNFNVINSDTALPANGTVVYGGDLRSVYRVAGAEYSVARLRSKVVSGSSMTLALGLANSSGSSVVNTEWTLPTSGGELALTTDSRFNTVDGKSGGTISSALVVNGPITVTSGAGITKSSASWVNESTTSNGNNITYKTNGPSSNDYVTNDFYVNTGNFWSIRNIMVNNGGVTRVWEMRSDNSFRSPGTVYAAGTALTSDVRLKSNFEDLVVNIDDIDDINPKFYDKKLPDEPTSVSRELGLVAQELEEVLPFAVSEYYWSDEYPDLKTVNYASLSVWTIQYVKLLKNELQSLQAEIKSLRDELNNK
ncbi:tail fiber domain-containing protein [Enterobacter kobei]|uniref:tail fiber domain-containing protein n=1 Tax=Enterobacter kobei TaxID=208224 RepID=UPI003B878525